jgi:hypothetical protein
LQSGHARPWKAERGGSTVPTVELARAARTTQAVQATRGSRRASSVRHVRRAVNQCDVPLSPAESLRPGPSRLRAPAPRTARWRPTRRPPATS